FGFVSGASVGPVIGGVVDGDRHTGAVQRFQPYQLRPDEILERRVVVLLLLPCRVTWCTVTELRLRLPAFPFSTGQIRIVVLAQVQVVLQPLVSDGRHVVGRGSALFGVQTVLETGQTQFVKVGSSAYLVQDQLEVCVLVFVREQIADELGLRGERLPLLGQILELVVVGETERTGTVVVGNGL